MDRRKRLLIMGAGVAAAVMPFALTPFSSLSTGAASPSGSRINCASNGSLCTEVMDSETVFGEGHYVGHDEPSLLFYSHEPGSGNEYATTLTLPVQPPVDNHPGGSTYDFQLHPAFWFGMAMCDTQSYPELVKTCIPDSDQNIADPSQTPYHAGTAFMEMQFYPPGWVPFNLPGGISCSARDWCAALNIDSLSLDPVNGVANNSACLNQVGEEYVNFAFITRDGKSQAPANPVDATAATYTPDPSRDLMMAGGDQIALAMHDTPNGLQVVLNDLTTKHSGSMTASISNGFAMVKYDPKGNGCTAIPYDFHPMYSTSSTQTRVPWAAHTYNVAFSDEIGHFDFCSAPDATNLSCNSRGFEGAGKNRERSDGDDFLCWPSGSSTLYLISGCANSNVPGFDGTSYLNDWPNGAPNRPTPIQFTSFTTGTGFTDNYPQVAFETDLPRVEQDLNGCDPYNNTGCTHRPITDDGVTAPYYPFYTIDANSSNCVWVYGSDVPGLSTNDFGKWNQYGSYDRTVEYTGTGGTPYHKSDDFRHILDNNPCPASPVG